MNLFSVIFLLVSYFATTRLSSVEFDEGVTEEGNYGRAYLDALVATMEVLYSTKGSFRTIGQEFDSIHEKFGIDVRQVKEMLLESDNILERDIEDVQTKFQADQLPVDKMENPLRSWTVDLMTTNFQTLKQIAEGMENQYIREMVDKIKETANQGVSELYKFQDNIARTMEKIDAVAATATVTTRRTARVYGTTKRSFL